MTIQMKSLQQYFHMVLFIQYVVPTFESVDKILCCDHLIHDAIYLVCCSNF